MRGRPRRRAVIAPGPLGRQEGTMPHPLVHPRARHTLRAGLIGTTATALAAVLGLSAAPAAAVQLGPLTKVSDGDPFAACTADRVGKQPGINYPATEIEPWIASVGSIAKCESPTFPRDCTSEAPF